MLLENIDKCRFNLGTQGNERDIAEGMHQTDLFLRQGNEDDWQPCLALTVWSVSSMRK